jgi:hypothetical protein
MEFTNFVIFLYWMFMVMVVLVLGFGGVYGLMKLVIFLRGLQTVEIIL